MPKAKSGYQYQIAPSPVILSVMKNTSLIYVLLALFLSWVSISCTSKENRGDDSPSIGKNRILNLGASRVEGARPIYESYRYELWKDLAAEDWDFDFIGTRKDRADYPQWQGESFDTDHEGYGGWTSAQLLSRLPHSLSVIGNPDIVLFSSPGGNDLLEGLNQAETLANINAIIEVLQAANPEVIIFLEQMAPAKSSFMNAELKSKLEQMHQAMAAMAQAQSDSSSKVMAIDMYSGFTDSLLADDVHYNSQGAQFIADRYYQTLQSELSQ